MPFDPDDISDRFWRLIESARKDREKLRQYLMMMTKDEVFKFALDFLDATVQMNDRPFTDYVNREESEDDIEYICWWVVSQGKEYYSDVWHNPEHMPKSSDMNVEHILYGVAEAVYSHRFGEMPDIWDAYDKMTNTMPN
jgi:hypothetical protein